MTAPTSTSDSIVYPIGRFGWPGAVTATERDAAIDRIAKLPSQLINAIAGLTDTQLDTPYRNGGWTLRQVALHVPDSHMNGFIRMKLALTEDNPTVRTFDENLFAQLPDGVDGPVHDSLALVQALHARWTRLLRALPESAFLRSYVHPDHGPVRLDAALMLYAWHGEHHAAQITAFAKHMGWK